MCQRCKNGKRARGCNGSNTDLQQPGSNLSQYGHTLPICEWSLQQFLHLRNGPSPLNHFPLEGPSSTGEPHRFTLVTAPGPHPCRILLPNFWNSFPYLPRAGLAAIYMRLGMINYYLSILRDHFRRYITNVQRGRYSGRDGPFAIQWLERTVGNLVTQARIYVSTAIAVEAARLQDAIDAASLMGRERRDDIIRAGTRVRQRVIDIGLLVDEVLPPGLRLTELPIDARRPREEQDFMRATAFVRDIVNWLVDGLPIRSNQDLLAELRQFVAQGEELDDEDYDEWC